MPYLLQQPPFPGDDRRRSPRFVVLPETTLIVGVAIPNPGGRSKTITGRVRDISAEGLSLLLPLDGGCRELTDGKQALVAVLTLPAGIISLRAEALHCRPLDWDRPQEGYVVGVRIREIGEEDHRRLMDYLSQGS